MVKSRVMSARSMTANWPTAATATAATYQRVRARWTALRVARPRTVLRTPSSETVRPRATNPEPSVAFMEWSMAAWSPGRGQPVALQDSMSAWRPSSTR